MTILHRWLRVLGMLTVGLAVGRYTSPPRNEALVASAPSPSRALVADRLFFGRAIPGGGFVSEAAWSAFFHEVVTTRFPEGLTVWRAEGQWTDPSGRLVHEMVMVLEVFH